MRRKSLPHLLPGESCFPRTSSLARENSCIAPTYAKCLNAHSSLRSATPQIEIWFQSLTTLSAIEGSAVLVVSGIFWAIILACIVNRIPCRACMSPLLVRVSQVHYFINFRWTISYSHLFYISRVAVNVPLTTTNSASRECTACHYLEISSGASRIRALQGHL